jgi:hypothetical protein
MNRRDQSSKLNGMNRRDQSSKLFKSFNEM